MFAQLTARPLKQANVTEGVPQGHGSAIWGDGERCALSFRLCESNPDQEDFSGFRLPRGGLSFIDLFGEIYLDNFAAKAIGAVVVDDAGGLHPGINDDRANELETSLLQRYGNLFQMYERITGEDPYQVPMRIFPAIHYTMGGLWVDYNLMSNVPGLFVLGEANFSDHGANRLGASALMQGLADGYFVIPYTIGDYLANSALPKITTDHDAFKEAANNAQSQINRLLTVKGNRGIREIHRELGRIMWDDVGMARTEASLKRALQAIPKLREEFWHNVSVPGSADNLPIQVPRDFHSYPSPAKSRRAGRGASQWGHVSASPGTSSWHSRQVTGVVEGEPRGMGGIYDLGFTIYDLAGRQLRASVRDDCFCRQWRGCSGNPLVRIVLFVLLPLLLAGLFVAAPFFALLIAILETALVFFAQQVLQTATTQAARLIMTGQAQSGSLTATQFKQDICNDAGSLLTSWRIYFETSGVTKPLPEPALLPNSSS